MQPSNQVLCEQVAGDGPVGVELLQPVALGNVSSSSLVLAVGPVGISLRLGRVRLVVGAQLENLRILADIVVSPHQIDTCGSNPESLQPFCRERTNVGWDVTVYDERVVARRRGSPFGAGEYLRVLHAPVRRGFDDAVAGHRQT